MRVTADSPSEQLGRGTKWNALRTMTPQQRVSTKSVDIPRPDIALNATSDALDYSTEHRRSFLREFAASKGPPQIILLVLLLAIGFGSTIGVVPAVMTDRYARLHYGYNDVEDCADYDAVTKPQACLDGSADAQGAVAFGQMVSNIITFFTSSYVGSISDEHGRKGILCLGILLSTLSPFCLVLLQLKPLMSPNWYYVAGASTGLINWNAVALSALADVMPPRWRAPSFGLLLAGFACGLALAPQLALWLGHWRVSLMSLINAVIGLFLIVVFFPETVKPEVAAEASRVRQMQSEGLTRTEYLQWMVYRPVWELTILNRNKLLRLLASLAFFSGMVTSGDQTLLLYYLEERLAFNDTDVATMFAILGLLGIFVQIFVLKPLNDCIGERKIVIFCFMVGCCHNILYGIATVKSTIFVSVAFASLTLMAFPTISAIKANNVEECEQGRIQGALYSVQAVASAAGPMAFRRVYQATKDGAWMGPGSMFIFAACFYVIAIGCALQLPPEADSKNRHSFQTNSQQEDEWETSSQTPLL